MDQVTKKQHYIWRYYLAPWTENNSNTGKIACSRKGHIFNVSLMNVAHENYFYGIKELSEKEKELISLMTIKNVDGMQKKVNQSWLDFYCAPFDFADDIERSFGSLRDIFGRNNVVAKQEFKNWNIAQIESFHGHVESKALHYIDCVRNNDLGFWMEEESRDHFSFYICNQYFRTKRMRDSFVRVVDNWKSQIDIFSDIRPNNMWLPLSLIFASNVGAHVAHDFCAILLRSENVQFIVGDQPVINTFATHRVSEVPKDVELFYPITPHSALLLTTNQKYKNGQILTLNANEVSAYNSLEIKSSGEMIFAKERSQLESLISR